MFSGGNKKKEKKKGRSVHGRVCLGCTLHRLIDMYEEYCSHSATVVLRDTFPLFADCRPKYPAEGEMILPLNGRMEYERSRHLY